MFLLKYTSLNAEGYYLVYAKTEQEAIEKLREHLYMFSQLHIQSATI